MKRLATKKRLSLQRTTLRQLDHGQLGVVAGGSVLPTVACTQNPGLPTSTGRLTFDDPDPPQPPDYTL